MSLDYLNDKNSNLKAFGSMIFCGSATIGTMRSGYNVNKILEITDDMVEHNAYHFVKNFPEMPVLGPSVWENDEYLESMKKENYDFAYFNCPCSSLSSINRNASVDGKNNIHFYRVYNIINKVEPRAFLIENAPTLIKLGYPILKDLTHILGDKYRFTIIRDSAGNHNVPMRRMRTLVVGWHRDHFNKIPLLQANKQPSYTIKDCIGDLYDVPFDESINHVCLPDREWGKYEHLFHLVPEGKTALRTFINHWDEIKDQFDDKDKKYIERVIATLKIKPGIWDKTPFKAYENGNAPSMTSLSKIIHPKNNRHFTVREYARLMSYPDDFILYEGGKTPIIQCLAQGVPANFVQYIASEIKEALLGNRSLLDDSEDKIVSFQHNCKMKRQLFNQDEIDTMTELEVSKSSESIEK